MWIVHTSQLLEHGVTFKEKVNVDRPRPERKSMILDLWSSWARQFNFLIGFIMRIIDSGPLELLGPDSSISLSILLRIFLILDLWSSWSGQFNFIKESVKKAVSSPYV